VLWKKVFDTVVTVTGLALLSVILLLIALLILVLDGRPIFFRQERVGLHKYTFQIYKFRTMHLGQVTRIGRFLRSTGLDELAQIVNVVKGEMSVVGPRPLTPADVRRLGWDYPHHAKRWAIKPGITGLAQLYGGRSARTSWWMDRAYRNKMSLRLDIWIVLVSFAINVFGKRRVRKMLWSGRKAGARALF
jgi:lipopolysaccharide/colanic/teichoic acid biosynthesis glycosyltransferase